MYVNTWGKAKKGDLEGKEGMERDENDLVWCGCDRLLHNLIGLGCACSVLCPLNRKIEAEGGRGSSARGLGAGYACWAESAVLRTPAPR